MFLRAASASVARKKKRSNTSSNTLRSSLDLASVAASASLKSRCSVQATCFSASNASRISEVPIATPSLSEVLGERQQLAVEPPGGCSGMPP